MKSYEIPPHVVLDHTKEVIFFVAKGSKSAKDITGWIKALNLSSYNGMIINSKCTFNRLKNQNCN